MANESRRPTLYGSRQAVSSGHYLASAAAQSILDEGGNAVDAGVAAGIALGVLHSHEVNFAGVAPIMIRPAGGEVVSIAGLGPWPASMPADLFVRDGGRTTMSGILRTVVPAAPDAWITALRDHGTMTFGEVAAEAIRFARQGFAMFEYFEFDVRKHRDAYLRWPQNRDVYLPGPGHQPAAVGDRFVQEHLANTIQFMADAEAAQGGSRIDGLEAARAAFYEGDIADDIVRLQREHGGYLSHEDLAGYRSPYERVRTVRWRDFEVFTCDTWSQGPVLAQFLRMLELRGLEGLGRHDVAYAHLVIEVMKAAFSDREYRYGDPNFVDVRLDELLSDEHSRRRLDEIDPLRARDGMFPPVGAQPDILDLIPAPAPAGTPLEKAPDTSYVCVIDRWGNAFSATPSDGAHGVPLVPNRGIAVSQRGTQSRIDPRHPSGVGPGRRPRLTPSPAMAIRDDGSLLTFGCPGGDMQAQAMLQVFLNVFHFGMDVQAAIDAPRFSTWTFPNSFAPHDYLANRVAVEDRFGDEFAEGLRALGHDVDLWPAFTRNAAAVEMIYLDARTGFYRAGADPRQPAYAIAS